MHPDCLHEPLHIEIVTVKQCEHYRYMDHHGQIEPCLIEMGRNQENVIRFAVLGMPGLQITNRHKLLGAKLIGSIHEVGGPLKWPPGVPGNTKLTRDL